MSHKPQKQQFDFKHGPPPEFDNELWELIEQAVKDKADEREIPTPQPRRNDHEQNYSRPD